MFLLYLIVLVCYEPYSLLCLDLLGISPAWFSYGNSNKQMNV